MESQKCFHCGTEVSSSDEILYDDKVFCCTGCKTVYEIFTQNDLSCYYDFEVSPGATPQEIKGKYEYLDNQEIVEKLLEFDENKTTIVSLYIPHIHCSSCIWILENLQKLQQGIISSQVNFPEKKVRITYNKELTNLKSIVYLLSSIGYEPYISLENLNAKDANIDRSLIYKIGVAFFCFGNIMLLSFPEYFEVEEFWINQYRSFFRWLIFFLSLPSFIYSASDYYKSAYKSIRSGVLNIDIPIALGIIVMFIRSTFDIVFDYGQGFFDSLTGLVFFMLLGKLFQQKTYSFLSFERDYKSYFPVAVTRLNNGKEEQIQVLDIEKGDRLLIRNQELIPVDGILISSETSIDYSFVTGEQVPIEKKSGDKVFAGGKQLGTFLEMEVLFSVSQSYLTQLWSNDIFQKKINQKHKTITDKVSQYFTPILLVLAFSVLIFWLFIDTYKAFNVFTAVLIVACPCALALTAPFTLGNSLRLMGRKKMYLKNAIVIEQLADVDTIVFDKTGTLTTNKKTAISYEGIPLNENEEVLLKSTLRASNHPLSRRLYEYLNYNGELLQPINFEEIVGKGIIASFDSTIIQLGSSDFLEHLSENTHKKTKVHVKFNGEYKGSFVFNNQYRKGLEELFEKLSKNYELHVLSGDNDGERKILEKMLPKNTILTFNQKPEEKLSYIANLQNLGKNVMMIGDGLNDAGALAQSNVGIAISENVNVFSPACDGILDASQFSLLEYFLRFSKKSMKTIYMSFGLSLMYNVIGLSFAVLGLLSPLVAAIIMPLSSITVVSFVTIMTNLYSRSK